MTETESRSLKTEGMVLSSQDVITMQKVCEILPNIVPLAKKQQFWGASGLAETRKLSVLKTKQNMPLSSIKAQETNNIVCITFFLFLSTVQVAFELDRKRQLSASNVR